MFKKNKTKQKKTMSPQQCVLVCRGLYETSNCMGVARFLWALQSFATNSDFSELPD